MLSIFKVKFKYNSIISKSFSIQKPFLKFNIISIDGLEYASDGITNVNDRILNNVGKSLHTNKYHPLGIISNRIKEFFYQNYRKITGSPIYSVYDNISPVVTVKQNFDDLLITDDHVSRSPSDTYYINKDIMLRSHTSAHESDLIRSGLDAFMIVGDVYRRDQVDQTHYPVFHQVEGVRLFTRFELFKNIPSGMPDLEPFTTKEPSLRLTPDKRPKDRQERHHNLTSQILESELKCLLENLAQYLFGRELNYRWVSAYFPWTYPSFELEVEVTPGNWVEMLGCGVIEQDMLDQCGAADRVGIAFGLGLERWAMKLFAIPDIRLFWSSDPGFLAQFRVDNIHQPITYKPVSVYPPCNYDISFWLPGDGGRPFHSNDFYELVGSIAGDMVERVELIDRYTDKATNRESHCYRVVYRHMSRNLTHAELNIVHGQLSEAVQSNYGCTIR